MPQDTLSPTSLIFPNQPDSLADIVGLGRFAQEMRARRLWIGQSLRIESHLAMAALASQVPGLALGSSVALTALMHPYEAAVEARSLSALTGMPYVAGFGPGAPEFQRGFMKEPYAKPLRAMHEYASVMRRLLDGEVVDHDGDHYRLQAGMVPLPAPPVEIGLGVLRPGMARTAGKVADVAITWLTPHWYVDDTLRPALEAGAAEAERTPPRVAAVVHAAVTRPRRNVRRCARAAAGVHLSAGHYTDMLQKAGIDADPADPAKGVDALIEAGVYATGTPDDIAATLRTFRESGVDEVILNVSGVHFTEGEASARRDVRDILHAEGSGD
jgi:alkanesulfonate monooxygenase SsuD/methylene tetrahydromethanopterin reductase-like flavin-dependent oxidoreductase (luciferase family)